jgi:hypothetical protein
LLFFSFFLNSYRSLSISFFKAYNSSRSFCTFCEPPFFTCRSIILLSFFILFNCSLLYASNYYLSLSAVTFWFYRSSYTN